MRLNFGIDAMKAAIKATVQTSSAKYRQREIMPKAFPDAKKFNVWKSAQRKTIAHKAKKFLNFSLFFLAEKTIYAAARNSVRKFPTIKTFRIVFIISYFLK